MVTEHLREMAFVNHFSFWIPGRLRFGWASNRRLRGRRYLGRMSDSIPFSPTIALLAVGRTWESMLADALEQLDLTTRKYGLLGHIQKNPGISFSELARRSRITVQSTHTAVAALVDKNLVDDGTAQPGAASTLQITEPGHALLAHAARALGRLDGEFAERHPELTEALRIHMMQVMSATD